MDEGLAVKTDNVSRWRTRNARASEDLAPRRGETGKSAWAHSVRSEGQTDDSLDPATLPPLVLQALCLFLWHAHASPSRRSKISGISFSRRLLPTELEVREDRAAHVVASLDWTHRTLLTTDESLRSAAAKQILEEGGWEDWRFTGLEIAELLETLLAQGVIREELRPTAAGIVERFSDTS